MNERIMELLPKDRYRIYLEDSLRQDYVQALTHLYQPLIGVTAVTIYQTFINEYHVQSRIRESSTHHALMNIMNLNLDQFYEDRKKLEAIGLLRTYVQDDENARTYFYVLIPPFSVKAFFQDPMLSILLKHHVGDAQYKRLKDTMMDEQRLPENVQTKTRSFDEVFTTIIPENPDLAETLHSQTSADHQSRDHVVDFEYLAQILRKYNIPDQKILTHQNRHYINSFAKIYQVNQLDLEKALLWSIDDSYCLSLQELHEACQDLYAKKYDRVSPKLTIKHDAVSSPQLEETASKEDKLIRHFESITHRELLEDLSPTGYASEQEVKMITNIMHQHGLPQPVMNVLIHYVLQKTDMKLTRNYVEKIATHWARKKVKTAKEAMKLAKSENKLYQSWGTRRTSKSQRKEVLPEWFKKQKQKEKELAQEKNSLTKNRDIEKEKQELARALKNITSKSFEK
ncbi:MAG: DnaD domain protein [Bacillaceae bacterium]|nr:DnaD domain protein [Bacillaceae bacterium]